MALCDVVKTSCGFLFDFFHTLGSIETAVDALPPESWAILQLDKEAWKVQWRASVTARMKGMLRDPYEMIAVPARAVNPNIAEWRIREAVETRHAKFAVALTMIDHDVQHTLMELRRRGKKLALVTNADASEMAAWPESPIRDSFDDVIRSCDVGLMKPEPGIYLLACERLKLPPADCVFIGDGSSDELAGAKALGMTTVQMTGIISELWPEIVDQQGRCADYRMEKISALLDNA